MVTHASAATIEHIIVLQDKYMKRKQQYKKKKKRRERCKKYFI